MWKELYFKDFKYDLSTYEAEIQDDLSNDGKVKFNSEAHEYIELSTGSKFTSVTTCIKNSIPPFAGSTVIAEKNMMLNKADVLAVWENNKQYAGNRGTYIHACLEIALKKHHREKYSEYDNSEIQLTAGESSLLMQLDFETKSYIEGVIKFIDSLIGNGKDVVFEMERTVYSTLYMVAGRYDMLLIFNRDGKTHRILLDWKTNNKELNKVYGSFVPFDLENSLINQYSIQLATYAYLEQRTITGAFIVHLRNSNVTPYSVNLDMYSPYVKLMLEYGTGATVPTAPRINGNAENVFKVIGANNIVMVMGALLGLSNKELEILKYLKTISDNTLQFEINDIDSQAVGCKKNTMRNYLSSLKTKLAIVPAGIKGRYQLNNMMSMVNLKLEFIW